MTRNDPFLTTRPLDDAIELAIQTYGALPVLARVLRATLRPTQRPPNRLPDDLPDYLRRDIGLDPTLRNTPERLTGL